MYIHGDAISIGTVHQSLQIMPWPLAKTFCGAIYSTKPFSLMFITACKDRCCQIVIIVAYI